MYTNTTVLRVVGSAAEIRRFAEEAGAAEADEIIRNTYRTLLTRGMKGCYVYCVDEPLARHLRESMTAWQHEAVSF